jgi:hypothetical protein
MIGLGRMGNGMTERLREHDHDVRTYDPNVESRTATSLEELKAQLDAPRAFSRPAEAGSYRVGDLNLNRIGYGAMQLAGPGVFGPPRDRAAAIEVLRTAVELGVNHIDTADAYGPYITNEIIREALFPYDNVHIVTKVGIVRDEQGGWLTGN